jgi:glycosyltransferase involved in cell wall biosynthesis
LNNPVSIVVPVLNDKVHVFMLLTSIRDQTFRPVEVVIVDGGSTDGTPALVEEFAERMNAKDFSVAVVNSGGNVSAAKNKGVRACHGENVLLLDADFVLSDFEILGQLNYALEQNEIAYFNTATESESFLEENLTLDSRAPLFSLNGVGGWAFRRELLERFQFDESLAFGEDMDFLNRLSESGLLRPALIKAVGLRHFPHTLDELRQQKFWYGRTVIMWVRKHHSLREILVLSPLVAIGLLISLPLAFFFSAALGVGLSVIFLSIPSILLVRSPTRNVKRMAYLILVRTIYGSFFFSVGFVQGLFQQVTKGSTNMSRDS